MVWGQANWSMNEMTRPYSLSKKVGWAIFSPTFFEPGAL